MQNVNRPVKWEKVYIFISSTFNDMHAERDFLIKRVFPELSEWCERRKLHMVDIDLRWGVTEADAIQNKSVVDICLKRIDDCRPFFVCLLGQRRGWVPKVGEISSNTFQSFPELRTCVGEASITEMEILHALICPLHGHAPRDPDKPVEYYKHVEHAFFYLREPSYLKNLSQTPPLIRQTYTNNLIENLCERKKADVLLQDWRENVIPDTGRPVRHYQANWDRYRSTPELSIPLQCPSLDPQNIKKWKNDWWKCAKVRTHGSKVSNPARKKAEIFNDDLTKGRLGNFSCEGKKLDEAILKDLKQAIGDRFKNHQETDDQDDLQNEIDQQEQFVFINSEGFIKRTGDFNTLDEFAKGSSNKRLFVLTAEAGSGKSALLANWVNYYRDQIGNSSNGLSDSIHFRFIGASDRSNTVHDLLRLLLREIKEVAGKLDGEIPDDPLKLRNLALELLRNIHEKGKTIIVIDALNQLETGLSDLAWLPRDLPSHIRLIVSFKSGGKNGNAVYESFRKDPGIVLEEVKPFDNKDDRKRLIREHLSQYLKELDKQHIDALIRLPAAQNPLYLKIMLSELRVFGSFANLAKKIKADFGDNPLSAFVGVLRRLEGDPAYSPINPKQAVPLIFGLLAHARHGLSGDELTSLLMQALNMKNSNKNREAASDTVYLFLRQVRPFLARRDGRFDFFYESFKEASLERYVSETEDKHPKQTTEVWNILLADYFCELPLWEMNQFIEENGSKDNYQPNRRKIAELPYHLVEAGEWETLKDTLCDLGFIEAKCMAGMTVDLLNDYETAQNKMSGKSVRRLQTTIGQFDRFVKTESHTLHLYPELTFQQAANQPHGTAQREIAEQLWRSGLERRPWLRVIYRESGVVGGISFPCENPPIDSSISDSGGRFAVCTGSIRVYEVKSRREIFFLPCSPKSTFTAIALSPDGNKIACSEYFNDDNGSVCSLWEIKPKRKVGELICEGLRVSSIRFAPTLNDEWLGIGGSSDYGGEVAVLDISGEKPGFKFRWRKEIPGAVVRKIAISRKGLSVIAAQGDGICSFWASGNGILEKSPRIHSDGVTNLCVSMIGDEISTSGKDGLCRVWSSDLKCRPSGRFRRFLFKPTNYEEIEFLTHQATPTAIAFLNEEHIISGDIEGNCYIWSPIDGMLLGTPFSAEGEISALVLSGDGSHLLVASIGNKACRIFETQTLLDAATKHHGDAVFLRFLENSKELLIARGHGHLQVLSVEKEILNQARFQTISEAPEQSIWAVCSSGRFTLAVDCTSRWKIFDKEKFTEKSGRFKIPTGPGTLVSISPDGQWVCLFFREKIELISVHNNKSIINKLAMVPGAMRLLNNYILRVVGINLRMNRFPSGCIMCVDIDLENMGRVTLIGPVEEQSPRKNNSFILNEASNDFISCGEVSGGRYIAEIWGQGRHCFSKRAFSEAVKVHDMTSDGNWALLSQPSKDLCRVVDTTNPDLKDSWLYPLPESMVCAAIQDKGDLIALGYRRGGVDILQRIS